MAGFQMPKRGSGAAMLRDLREDERPPLDEPQAETSQQEAVKQSAQSYDNMTNNLTTKQSEQTSGILPDKPDRKKPVKQSSQKLSQKDTLLNSPSAGQSVAEMIRRRSSLREEQEVLKTVTLKLSPTLDERIEKYCFENKMKKQEFWAEAAALYFEMIAEGAGE